MARECVEETVFSKFLGCIVEIRVKVGSSSSHTISVCTAIGLGEAGLTTLVASAFDLPDGHIVVASTIFQLSWNDTCRIFFLLPKWEVFRVS